MDKGGQTCPPCPPLSTLGQALSKWVDRFSTLIVLAVQLSTLVHPFSEEFCMSNLLLCYVITDALIAPYKLYSIFVKMGGQGGQPFF